MSSPPNDLVVRRIDDWRRRLIDLSYRNRLIRYRPTKATTLAVAAPSIQELVADPGRTKPWRFYFPPDEPDEGRQEAESDAADTVDAAVVKAARHANRPREPDEIEVTEPSPKRINRVLDSLAKRSNSEFQDKALRVLYIAAGFLDWIDPVRGEALTSPLVLVPVELRRASARHPYELFFVDDEDVVINPSLTEKLSRDAGLAMPEDWVWEDKPIAQELEEIRGAIAGTDWTVREEAVIGMFSFQKYVMYRDLLDNEKTVAAHPLIRSLAEKRLTEELSGDELEVPDFGQLDEVQSPKAAFSILDSDATQRRCLEAARRGQSFVMHGPPGTGKSQTIANLVAEAIAAGKKILFVSEKAAALDVVHKRLASRGLEEFCLMLHGEHAGRREVVEALHRSLTSELIPREGMRLDELERLDSLRTMLNSSVELLHLPQGLLGDYSLREVHAQLATLHQAPSIPGAPNASEITGPDVRDELRALDDLFERLAERWHVSSPAFIWTGYDAQRFTGDDRARVLATVSELENAAAGVEAISGDAARAIGWPAGVTLRAARQLADLGALLVHAPALEPHWLSSQSASDLAGALKDARTGYEGLAAWTRALSETYPARPVEELSPDMAGRLNTAEKSVEQACGIGGGWADRLDQLPRCVDALRAVPDYLDALAQRASEAANLLGQPAEGLTLENADRLGQLADVAFHTEDRPEPDWLVRAALDRARQTIEYGAPLLQSYQQHCTTMLETYTDAALELDAVRLQQRFETEYKSAFAKLKPDYRRDAKTVKGARRDGSLPSTVIDELRLIAATRDLGAQIDAHGHRYALAFGSYYRGRDTEPERIQRAVGVAELVHTLASPDSDHQILAQRVCTGSTPDAATARVVDQLRAAASQLEAALAEIRQFVPGVDEMLGREHLAAAKQRIVELTAAVEGFASIVRELSRGEGMPLRQLDEARRRAKLITGLHRVRLEVSQAQELWRRTIGPRFIEAETDWASLERTAEWLSQLFERSGNDLPETLRSKLEDDGRTWPDFNAVVRECDRYVRASDHLAACFEPGQGQVLKELLDQQTLFDVKALCQDLSEHVDDLFDWTELSSFRAQAREDGWDEFVGSLIDQGVPKDQVVPAFQRAYWNGRLEALYDDEPGLEDDFRGGTYQRWIDDFRGLDRRLVQTGADRLIVKCNAGRGNHVAIGGSEVALLRHEAGKRKRHRPVRMLLAALPTLLSELKPCLMMSPLSVSHFLSPAHSFDLVVFDEASQVPPQDAVNCIYRGDQLIVAGDNRQLPPTSFWQLTESDENAFDEELEGSEEDMESILDSCQALLAEHRLLWHYRSRQEQLIAFSNHHIYEGLLRTFPSADAHPHRMGVDFTHVPDGIYDRAKTATNRQEAKVVAQRVVDHLMDGSGRSVGVIAFNTAQATAISEELDLLKLEHPEIEPFFGGDRLDNVFVKHLEAVQGDERDVIVFSMGYGRDAEGRFTMNFGPLNRQGGERRLNVAITRAREKVEIVASVTPRDFSLSDSASAGARLLRDYLSFAKSGGHGLGSSAREESEERAFASPLEASVADAIRELGYEPLPDVGAGRVRLDIGVIAPEDPDRFLLGVECDGASYRAIPTARDRERLRGEVLAGLGWHVHRVFSLDWVRNRAMEIERLASALEAAKVERPSVPDAVLDEGEAEEEGPRQRKERVVHELRGAADAEHLPWVRRFERAKLSQQSTYYEFHETVNRTRQTDLLVELLAVEAPVSIDYAIRRIAECWSLHRAGHRVVSAGRQAISQAKRRGAVEVRGEFLWRPGQTLVHVRVPDPADPATRRDIDEIPPEEIDLTLARLREASAGAGADDLLAQAARVLGFDRTGDRIKQKLKPRLSRATSGHR